MVRFTTLPVRRKDNDGLWLNLRRDLLAYGLELWVSWMADIEHEVWLHMSVDMALKQTYVKTRLLLRHL